MIITKVDELQEEARLNAIAYLLREKRKELRDFLDKIMKTGDPNFIRAANSLKLDIEKLEKRQ